jgi:hypothetical protein
VSARVVRAAAYLAWVPLLMLGWPAGPAVGEDRGPSTEPTVWAQVLDDRITESSGLASGAMPGRLWTHNDSGDGPVLYALTSAGTVDATLTLTGVDARDFEGMAAGEDRNGNQVLVVGDIGDNAAVRENVQIHVVPEPSGNGDLSATPTTYLLQYPEGPQDAETVMLDPTSGEIVVVAKASTLSGAGVYRLPPSATPGALTTLERIGSVQAYVTDGAFLPDGRAVLRTYLGALLYDGFDDTSPVPLDVPPTPQGESVADHWAGDSVLVGSEGAGSTIYRVPVPPQESASSDAATESGSSESSKEESQTDESPGTTAAAPQHAGSEGGRDSPLASLAPWAVLVALLLTLGALVLRLRSRRE